MREKKRTLEERLADRVSEYMRNNDITLKELKIQIEAKVCRLSRMERDFALKM